jgi:hypothetical protein
MEYLLMIMVVLGIIVSVWLFMSSSKQGSAITATEKLRGSVIDLDITTRHAPAPTEEIIVPPEPLERGQDFFVVAYAGIPLAAFTDNGNILIKGVLQTSSSCSGEAFAVRDGAGKVVASIDAIGNLCISGEPQTFASSCPGTSLFILKKEATILSSIESSGALCLTGNLTEGGV